MEHPPISNKISIFVFSPKWRCTSDDFPLHFGGLLFNGGWEDENKPMFNVPYKRDHFFTGKFPSSSPISF